MRWSGKLGAGVAFFASFVLGAMGAEESGGPNVPGYERFYRAVGSPEDGKVAAGLLLMAELRCTACHEAPKEWQGRLAAAPGPDLRGVGSRRTQDGLWECVYEPAGEHPGALMPALFAEGAEFDAATNVVYYLQSLKEELAPAPAGDVARGRELFHQVGCVACHDGSESGQKAADAADVVQQSHVEAGKITSGSMIKRAMVDFLLDPLRTRPDGRMPSSRLSLPEAADVAAYLGEVHPSRADEVMAKDATRAVPAGAVSEGEKVYAQRGCANCHGGGPKLEAAPLAKLAAGRGCLAQEPAVPAAQYHLEEGQRTALAAALAEVQAGAPKAFTPAQEVDWQMTRLNCYACHVRNGKGGPDASRLPDFTVNDSGIESLGELGHLPPNLSHVGRKLTEGWFAKILWGEGGSVRLYMNTRMPNFGRANTEALIPLFQAADKLERPVEIDTSGLLSHQRAEPGRLLMGTTGVSCVSCHGLKDKPSLGPPVIRLTHTVERLRPEYFKELLLDPQATQPGTVMPPLFIGRKNADKEIESIWTYLREIDGQPLPEGLLAQGDFELKPSEAGRTIVFRSFIETGGTHAIGVGFPTGLNACFDARHCRWTLLWKGRFLDAMENWQDRMMKPIRALGTDLHEPPPETAPREFRGYRLEKDGTPVMLYTEAGEEIDDKLEPDPSGQGFIRTIQRHSGGQTTSSQETWKW